MKISKKLAVMVTSVSLVAGGAWADGHVDPNIAGAIKARQSMMQLYAYNLGQLGAMAKTTVPYDAEAASKSAGNLLTLMSIDQSTMWPQGSDTPTIEGTAALPAIWDNWEDFTALARQFTEDSQKLVTLSDGLSIGTQSAEDQSRAVRAAFFRASKSCSGCHERFRLDQS